MLLLDFYNGANKLGETCVETVYSRTSSKKSWCGGERRKVLQCIVGWPFPLGADEPGLAGPDILSQLYFYPYLPEYLI